MTLISSEFDKLVLSNCFPVLCHKFLNGKIFIVSKRNKFYYIYIPANKKKKYRRPKEQKNLIHFCKNFLVTDHCFQWSHFSEHTLKDS